VERSAEASASSTQASVNPGAATRGRCELAQRALLELAHPLRAQAESPREEFELALAGQR